MSELATDIWGHCETCRRWFACPTWFDKHAAQPLCPVCLSEPAAIENRAGADELPGSMSDSAQSKLAPARGSARS